MCCSLAIVFHRDSISNKSRDDKKFGEFCIDCLLDAIRNRPRRSMGD